jgi:hypothetical protein
VPREPRVAAAGRRDRSEHPAALRIDFLNAIFGELKQMLAVERGASVRGHLDRSHGFSACGVEGGQPVASGEPDMTAVIGDAAHVVDLWKGAVLADDFGR